MSPSSCTHPDLTQGCAGLSEFRCCDAGMSARLPTGSTAFPVASACSHPSTRKRATSRKKQRKHVLVYAPQERRVEDAVSRAVR